MEEQQARPGNISTDSAAAWRRLPGAKVVDVRSRSMRGRLPAGLLAMPAAAFAVHQLRYGLAYGSHARAALAAQGHAYLHSLVPWLVVTLAVGLARFVRRAAQALRTGDAGTSMCTSFAMLWAVTFGGLLGIYAVQESLEEYFASGHPTGMAGVFGHGGWWSLPAAALVSVIVVAALRLGRSIVQAAGRLAPRRYHFPVIRQIVPNGLVFVPARPLTRSAAGRAPPR
jgi:hypothetical protein